MSKWDTTLICGSVAYSEMGGDSSVYWHCIRKHKDWKGCCLVQVGSLSTDFCTAEEQVASC